MKMLNQRIYTGKIMLFGEYSIIGGSSALLIPYSKVKASWARLSNLADNKKAAKSNESIAVFRDHLLELYISGRLNNGFDFERLDRDLENGLYLDSDIPENYGLGSSGALCAAIYGDYASDNHNKTMQELRSLFALMESYFHGSSSGVDPLCIFLGKNLLIRQNNHYKIPEDDMAGKNILQPFLLDTGLKSKTASMVQCFVGKMAHQTYNDFFNRRYIPVVDSSVDQWSEGLLKPETIRELSSLQYMYLNQMIPDAYHALWQQGLKTGHFYLKLCGSGGGGMLLGFTANLVSTRAQLNEQGIEMIVIS